MKVVLRLVIGILCLVGFMGPVRAEGWRKLGSVPPKDLSDTRIQVHYAVQLLAAAAVAWAEPQEDSSHKSFVFDPESSSFLGHFSESAGLRVALAVPQLELRLLDKQGKHLEALPLEGTTSTKALDWLRKRVRARWKDAPQIKPHVYDHDFPEHAVGKGAPFKTKREHRIEIARHFGNATRELKRIRAAHPETSPAVIWPHHFDIATLITVGKTSDGKPQRIGVGLSPGDFVYPEPYWYVSPSPAPAGGKGRKPAAGPAGHWRQKPWYGAALPTSEVLRSENQLACLRSFLADSIAKSKALLE